jgi:hypothetical protein
MLLTRSIVQLIAFVLEETPHFYCYVNIPILHEFVGKSKYKQRAREVHSTLRASLVAQVGTPSYECTVADDFRLVDWPAKRLSLQGVHL